MDESANPLLRKLARLLIDGAGEPVLVSEVSSYAAAAPLLRSRLVVERSGALSFPLVILAQWFAARDLEEGGTDVAALALDEERLRAWATPLAMCVSEASEDNVARLMRPIARERPAVASQVMFDAFVEWGPNAPDRPLPSWRNLGERIREAMETWSAGLGPLAGLVAPVHPDGSLRGLGVRVSGSGACISWARGQSMTGVVELPDGSERSNDWLGFEVRHRFHRDHGWAWHWTLDQLRGRVERLLEHRSLPEIEALRREFRWRAALSLIGREGSSSTVGIPWSLLQKRLREYPLTGTYSSGLDTFEVERVRDVLERWMATNLGKELHPPWAGPDDPAGPMVWSGYSAATLLARTRQVFAAALVAYFEVVGSWLSAFQKDLELCQKRPFKLVGMVEPHDGSDRHDVPGICYYLEPNPGGPDFLVDLKIGDADACRRFGRHANQVLEQRGIGFTSAVLHVFDLDSAEALAHSWLLRDLRDVHWA